MAIVLALPAGCTALAGIQDGVLSQTDASTTDGASGGDTSTSNEGGGDSTTTPDSGPGDSASGGDTGQGADSAMTDSGAGEGGVCPPGRTECNDAGSILVCTDAGQWEPGATCLVACVNGQCTGSCAPGTTQSCGSAATCNAGGMQTCDNTGAWGACSIPTQPCAAVPTGWQPYSDRTGGSCPSGFANPQAFLVAATGTPDTCSCSCSGTQSCSATAQLAEYTNPTCSGSGTLLDNLTVTSACTQGGFGTANNGDYYSITNIAAASGPACSASPSVSGTSSVQQTTTELCTPTLACPGGACLDSSQQTNLCIATPGNVLCPTGYTQRTIVAGGYLDTRSCGGCACGSTLTCALASVLLDNDSVGCSMGSFAFSVLAPGFCNQATFSVSGAGACSTVTTASQPTGGVSLDPTTTQTVCCP